MSGSAPRNPRTGSSRRSLVEEPLELPRADRVLKFSDGLRLDLTYALARHLEDLADLFEGVRVAVADPVTQLDDFALAEGQRLKDLIDLVLQHLVGRGVDGAFGLFVFDEVAEVAVLAVADGP